MCGIVGLFSKSAAVSDALGLHLGEMLLQLADRGPDSAGVAFYRDPAPPGSSKVSLFSADPRQDWAGLAEVLGAGEPEVHGSHAVFVLEVEAGEAVRWLQERYPELRVMSAGEAIEI
jgi:methylamine---glutamate N-methyltransferase subunit A